MKRLIGFILTILVIYAIYFDLSHGTLRIMKNQRNEAKAEEPAKEYYFEKEVGAGETVLTIVENHVNEPVSVPIHEVIQDFKHLNKGIDPKQIQQGKTYKFPVYSESD